jgi:histidine triad (HIT) family protein
MDDCIFCKIVRGEIPCYSVYENNFVKAFLDINPWTRGHTLVIPKKHYENIFDITEDELKEIISVVKKISVAYKKIFNCDINLIQSNGKNAQQEVFHFHMHIIPRYKQDNQKIIMKVDEDSKKNLKLIMEEIKLNEL